MRNIWEIAKEDFRKISLNAISLLVCIGLICIPSVYAWFNIGGSWDPYGNTQNLSIAVINEDEGYENDLLPVKIKIGSDLVNMLVDNTSFRWEFMSKEEALNKLNNADIYAAIEIPKDFSKKILTILNGENTSAELIYYNDEKKNALAPKITSKGVDTIQKKINNVITEQVLYSVFKTAVNLIDFTKSESVVSLVKKLSTSFGDASLSIKGASLQLQSVKDLTGSLQELFDKIQKLMPEGQSSTSEEITQLINELKTRCAEAQNTVNDLIAWLEDIGISEQGTQTLREISSLLGHLSEIIGSTEVIGKDVVENIASLQSTLNSASNLVSSIDTQLDNMFADFDVIASDLDNAKIALDSLGDNATLDKVQEIIGSNPRSLAQIVSSPVQAERHAVYPIENNGSSMAAFFTSLSIWVGATILLAIMKVEVSPARIQAINRRYKKRAKEKGKKYKPVKNRHIYFGRYAIFGTLALAQTTLICLGEIFFIGIQCVHPWLFLFTGWLLALLFSLLIYTLTLCFGNIGKAIAVILLVLQVAASGGMFPMQMICWPFNLVYPYLPLSYSIDSFHYCIAGFGNSELYLIWIILILYMVPISLIFGLALSKFFKRTSKWFNEKIHESKIIA